MRHVKAALQRARLAGHAPWRQWTKLTDAQVSIQPMQRAGLRMYSASVPMTKGRLPGPARDTREEAEPDIPILEALLTAGPAGQVLLQGWAAGSYDSRAVQHALKTIRPLQVERAAAASTAKAVKRKNAEFTMDKAPTA